MIQVRCPECGYIQTLSEERFMSISDDFLHCPHCNAKVPKEWNQQESDSVPEEARHKMLAFSRRILNGGAVAREVVFALESLVRHYGPMEESNKALGLGYAAMGEKNKAEEFLRAARHESAKDPQVLRCLLEVLFNRKKFDEASGIGEALLQLSPSEIRDEDAARLALSYIWLNNGDKAKEVLDSHPAMDQRNALVKKARRELNRLSGAGIRSIFTKQWPFQGLWTGGAGRESLKALTGKAKKLVSNTTQDSSAENVKRGTGVAAETTPDRANPPVTLEYWIYSTGCGIPTWDEIRTGLVDCCSGRAERQRVFKFLETVIERNDLTIEYILRKDSREVFYYPEDLIPCNSRELSREDRTVLTDAQMIVRLRLCLPDFIGTDHVVFMTKFVESVRNLTNGVVQDAISHVLWGTEQWKKHAQNAAARLVESNILFEILAEDGNVWIHTHGMEKFGMLDVEIDGVPEELAAKARTLATIAAEVLIASRNQLPEFPSEIVIPGTDVLMHIEIQAPDPEGHFPDGSLKIRPFTSESDPLEEGSAEHALSVFVLPSRSHSSSGRKSESSDKRNEAPDKGVLRNRLIEAHKRAKEELALFKTSFQQTPDPDEHVHAVKVGFPTQGGSYEWMWVSLDAWRGQSIVGHLENTPVLRKDLAKGARVQITEGEIFDWVIASSGDVLKGGYTEHISVLHHQGG